MVRFNVFHPADPNIRRRMFTIFKKICGKQWNGTDGDRRLFQSAFGVSPQLCLRLWGMCFFPPRFNFEHFMNALFFLKTYPTQDVLEMKLSFSRKTIIKYTWIVIERLSQLSGQVVSLLIG